MQVMGETGLVKPLSEDPDNTYLYRDLRDQHWDRFKALIPVRKAGILTPDPVGTKHSEHSTLNSLNSEIRDYNTGHWTLDTGHWTLDTGHLTLDT